MLGVVLGTATLLSLGGCRSDAPSPYAGIPVIRDDTLWQFPSGATAASYLRQEIAYIGLITDDSGGAYVLASGVECNDCDAGLSVLLQPVGGVGTPPGTRVPALYAYPGEIRHESGVPMFRSRLFWGQCLPGRRAGLVQFAAEFDNVGRQSRAVVRVTEARNGRVVDDSLKHEALTDAAVKPRVDDGHCREIPPRAQWGF